MTENGEFMMQKIAAKEKGKIEPCQTIREYYIAVLSGSPGR
jgi:hypothetical protein